MTVALAEAVDREPRGPYGDLRFRGSRSKNCATPLCCTISAKWECARSPGESEKTLPAAFCARAGPFRLHPQGHPSPRRGAKGGSAAFAVEKQAAERLRALDEESRRMHGELDRYAEFIAKANEPTLLLHGTSTC